MYNQHTAHLRLVDNSFNKPIAGISYARVYGEKTKHINPTPLLLQRDDGRLFWCAVLSVRWQKQIEEMSNEILNQRVAYSHDGFDEFGYPINPCFKTILPVQTGGAA